METEVVKIDRDHPDMQTFKKAGQILKEGGLVAFPTETVYGLGANALDEEASRKIYAAKGLLSDNPLIVHIARMEDLGKIVKKVPEEAVKLAQLTGRAYDPDHGEKRMRALWDYRRPGYRGGKDAFRPGGQGINPSWRRLRGGSQRQHLRTPKPHHRAACI